MNLEEKIIFFIDTVYGLSQEKKQQLKAIIDELDDDSKNKIAIIFYDRYNDYIKNISIYNRDLQIISNELEEGFEKLATQEVEFNF